MSSLKKKAWKLFSEYVRSKDADDQGRVECFTCGKVLHWKQDAQAGHAIGGRHNAVLFDESIVRPQCCHCNIFLRGNYSIFAIKLIRENSMEWFEKKLADSRKTMKYTRSDLNDLIDLYKSKLKAIELREAA
jgi:hypothetical protein